MQRQDAAGSSVLVWDRVQRLLHWSLVAAVAVAWLKGEAALDTHIVAGYVALAIVALRLVWGWIGSRHARFSSFVLGVGPTLSYARDLVARRSRRYLGHNPLGGWMIIAMVVCLLVCCASGIAYTTDRFWGLAWVEAVHRISAWTLLVLIGCHVLGVLVMSWQHGENLVGAMLTGRKRG
ncbi:Cytochrome b [Burkholderiales bacterium 8X]|nr:Cytochrome b [Burkholderiales bacterium 8X]